MRNLKKSPMEYDIIIKLGAARTILRCYLDGL